MRNRRGFYFILALLSFSLAQPGCTRDTTAIPATEDILISNSWSVDYYFDSQDLTNQYNNAKLLFSNTGAAAYEQPGQIIAGTWGRSVDPANNEMISFHFNSSDTIIAQLNRSWKLLDRTGTTINLEETDGPTSILFRLRTQ
jgi:hypothetical protein